MMFDNDKLALWEGNVGLLYDKRADVMQRPKLFMAPVFWMTYYLSGRGGLAIQLPLSPREITIGAVFTCWDSYPDLFRIEQDGQRGYLLWISGSPVSGSNVFKCYDPVTKNVWDGKDISGFHILVDHLNACQSTLDNMLHGAMEKQGLKDFTPFTLKEVIEKVINL